MFCQHTEPAVYYTCRVSSSCDDLKLGEYTTTQDTFRILLNNIYKTKKLTPFFHWYLFWNAKLLVVYFLVVFIGKPCHVCKYQPWLTNEYHQKKNDIFNFCLLSSIISNLCWVEEELSLRSSHFTAFSLSLSLSLLYCNSICVHCQPQVWHLFMLSVWEKRRQEKGSPMVISTTIFSLLITTGDSFLRPHDQTYHQEMDSFHFWPVWYM